MIKNGIAIAPCAFELPGSFESNRAVIQVMPAGEFRPTDGRALSVDGWRIDADSAAAVVADFNQRANPAVLDYEHQTLYADTSGKPAPAAGWIESLEWRDSGLWATVELTDRARELIKNREYRYFSPVFTYDQRTGQVLSLLMGALTNNPAIHGMADVELLAAARFGLQAKTSTESEKPTEEAPMKKLLTLLGLKDTATEDEAVAALNARLEFEADVRKAVALDDSADTQTVVAACAALKQDSGNPDPAKYVPIESVQSLQTEVAALSARIKDRDDKDIGAMIDGAIADGRLPKTLETWARDLGGKDVAALSAYLDKAQPIAALTRTQTDGKKPVVDEETGLTAEETAVCTAMGLSVDEFKAANAS